MSNLVPYITLGNTHTIIIVDERKSNITIDTLYINYQCGFAHLVLKLRKKFTNKPISTRNIKWNQFNKKAQGDNY